MKMKRSIQVLLTTSVILMAEVTFNNIPELGTILDACENLTAEDIPVDSFLPPEDSILYIASDGDDLQDGSIDSPLKSLREAIKRANKTTVPMTIYLREGDHIYLDGSTYQQVERGNIWIGGYPGEEVWLRPAFFPNKPKDWGEAHCFDIRGSFENITFDNINFEGWNTLFYAGSGYDEEPLRNLVIKNITAKRFISRFDGEGNGVFFSTDYVQENVYGDSKVIFDNGDDAKFQIEGLTIANVSVNDLSLPINIGDENDANVKGMRISNFSVVNPPANSGNSASDAIAIVNSANVLLDHIQIENIADDGIDCKSYNVSVVNSIVRGTGRNGIKFWRGGEIINSVIYNCTQINDASLVGGSTGSLRFINSILGEKQLGYSGGWNDTVSGKLEMVNSVFIDLKKSFFVRSFKNFTAENNCYFNVPEALYTGEQYINDVAELNSISQGTNNIDSDPLFSAIAEGEYSVEGGSPLIDGGSENTKLPSFDLMGNSRILGDGIDIGPIEHGETSVGASAVKANSRSVSVMKNQNRVEFTIPNSEASETLSLYNSRGQLMSELTSGVVRSIDLSRLSSGVYYYKISNYVGSVVVQ